MGRLLNPSQIKFYEAVNSEIYVDKSELLCYTNSVIRTEQKYVCVSSPGCFGFLRGLLKDEEYIALVYMTGILPIKEYGFAFWGKEALVG